MKLNGYSDIRKHLDEWEAEKPDHPYPLSRAALDSLEEKGNLLREAADEFAAELSRCVGNFVEEEVDWIPDDLADLESARVFEVLHAEPDEDDVPIGFMYKNAMEQHLSRADSFEAALGKVIGKHQADHMRLALRITTGHSADQIRTGMKATMQLLDMLSENGVSSTEISQLMTALRMDIYRWSMLHDLAKHRKIRGYPRD